MRARLLAAAVISVAMPIAAASATVVIRGDNGGMMEEYVKRFRDVRRSSEHVVIDGACMSACTMVLGLIPRERLCATPQAVFGFHAAWEVTTAGKRIASVSGTYDLMKTYPAAVRAWIARNGGLRSDPILLSGRQLTAIVPRCSANAVAEAGLDTSQVTRRVAGTD